MSPSTRNLTVAKRAQGVTENDPLPAQERKRQVITFSQVAPVAVGGQKVIGPHATRQVGLVDVAGRTGGAFVDGVRAEPLRRPGKQVFGILPRRVGPVVGRTLQSASVRGDEFRGDRTG